MCFRRGTYKAGGTNINMGPMWCIHNQICPNKFQYAKTWHGNVRQCEQLCFVRVPACDQSLIHNIVCAHARLLSPWLNGVRVLLGALTWSPDYLGSSLSYCVRRHLGPAVSHLLNFKVCLRVLAYLSANLMSVPRSVIPHVPCSLTKKCVSCAGLSWELFVCYTKCNHVTSQ
jgi:hypothetical protein